MKIVYFGTPLLAAEVLKFLIENGIQVVAVVTRPDKPRGRSGKHLFSPVKEYVLQEQPEIPLYQPAQASDPSFVSTLLPLDIDLFVVVAYGEIMRQNLLDLPKKGSINLHASLLPEYRGAAPMQFALLSGAERTGVTIIEMVLKMDAGPILATDEIPISEEMDCGALEREISIRGKKCLLRVLQNFPYCWENRQAQEEGRATYVKKITPDMAQINWEKSAQSIHCQVRAFSPKPGAWTYIASNGQYKRLKVWKSAIVAGKGKGGETHSFSKKEWVIACGSGALSLLEVQLEGKKRLCIADFLQGFSKVPQIKL